MSGVDPHDEDMIAKHGRASAAALRAAGEVYGAILADPERADEIRAHMATLDGDARRAS